MAGRIYLDYNATAPLRPEAKSVMAGCLGAPHNASSLHSFGRQGRDLLETAREQVASLVGASAGQVIFNSGATEANNTVLRHFDGQRILVSAVEHPSVLGPAAGSVHIGVNADGVLDLHALEDLLKEDKTALVSVMMVNNETGVIQPVKESAALAKRYGALFHTDAVQAAGRLPIDIAALGADFLTLSSHKIGGPQGAGALVLGLCAVTPVLLKGGGQEKYARAGTENVAAIAGFGAAAQAAQARMEEFHALAKSRDRLERELHKIRDIVIYGQNAPRVANTTLFSLPGLSSETLLMALDLEHIAVSNGAACSSGKVEPSAVLKAMGVPDKEAKGALRVSMGWDTKPEDIDGFLDAWQKIIRRLNQKMKETKD